MRSSWPSGGIGIRRPYWFENRHIVKKDHESKFGNSITKDNNWRNDPISTSRPKDIRTEPAPAPYESKKTLENEEDIRRDTPMSTGNRGSHQSTNDRRTGKVFDPSVWHEQQDKNRISFEIWHRLMTNKLKINHDYIVDDYVRRTYIEERFKKDAIKSLMPYLASLYSD